MSVRFKYYLRGCGLGILVASLVFIVSLHAHGGAMSDEKAMQRASELGMIMPDDTQTQEAETQTTELPVKETNLPDTQRTTQAVTQKVPQNDTQKQTERDTSSEQNDTPKESEKKAEEKKKTQDSQKKVLFLRMSKKLSSILMPSVLPKRRGRVISVTSAFSSKISVIRPDLSI